MDVCDAFGHDLICRLTQSRATMGQNVCSIPARNCVAARLAESGAIKPQPFLSIQFNYTVQFKNKKKVTRDNGSL